MIKRGGILIEALKGILNIINIGIAITNKMGKIFYSNSKASSILEEYEEGHRIKKPVLELLKNVEIDNTSKVSISQEEEIVVQIHELDLSREEPIYGIIFCDVAYIENINFNISFDDVKELLEYTNDAIFIDDMNGKTIWVNKACEEMYDIKKDDVIGKSIDFLEQKRIFYPSVAKLVFEQKKQVTILHSNKNGKQVLTTGTPILFKNGNIKKVVSTSRDITELITLKNQLEDAQHRLEEYKELQKDVYDDFIVKSKKMTDVIQLSRKLSQIDSTVLITGESGVGKGKVAKYIHKLGIRKDKPFVKVNCGAIPEMLIESELFGYEHGAFTGSSKRGKMGLFELAQNGTIFLDEIGELPLNLQVKLLQAIQDKEIQKVGGIKTIKIDVRIITATNRNLKEMVARNEFREDLYYRLNVVPIHIPPIRERHEDIIPLSRHFLKIYNSKFNVKKRMDPNTINCLMKYSWPGNVRELENIIERLVITSSHNTILPDCLPNHIIENKEHEHVISIPSLPNLKDIMENVEKQIINDAVTKYKTTRSVAKALGVSQPTIVRKMGKYNIKYSEMDEVIQ
ncbi:sigma 54-interacting transcriptional regulator [Wukongibacter baidiensis]|uniref:sigma-54 interaction domain-containing protein n=1 Tax=Wukongibacter baidiensis TaxID=1723361 RepID=UPI003D7F915F